MACDYVLDNGVSLSTPSRGLSWAAGMIFTIVSGHESAEIGGNSSGWGEGVTAGGVAAM